MAVRTKTASPATPPTMPPASTEGGGVSSLLLFDDAVLVAEPGAVAVAEPPITLASGLWEGLEDGKEPSADDDAPAEADKASEEMRDAALLRALLADCRAAEAEL
jgi:hypothetical protein